MPRGGTRGGPVKVVHLVTMLELGGAQGNTIYTVRHLDPSRFDAHLWCGPGGFWDNDVRSDLARDGRLKFFSRLVRPVHPLFDFLVIFDLWRAFRAARPAVVHTHSSKAGIVGRIAARLAGVPVIVHTFHGFGFNDRQKPWTRSVFTALERLTARWSTALIFVSKSNQQTAAELRIGRPERYHLIRSGIPLESLRRTRLTARREDVLRELGIPADAAVITTISAFKPQKNLTDFLELGRRLAEKNSRVHLLLLGDGEQRAELEEHAKRIGLDAHVHMPGWRRDAAAILAASNAFVLTSLWEGLPRALVEAMTLGVPSVCYETDGVRDLLNE
ncbi:MAG: glycosyltransferase, partial [Elusimicrobia bacterium]|nr:glycosyltransferase [Elusimicrobiota bacterium]